MLKQGIWTPAAGDDYKENILFAKILMSYYPIAPGRCEDLFSTKEALDAIDAFDTLVNPRRNLSFLNRGTALIIPLGKGKYTRIIAKDNIERVRARLGVFASISKDQKRNAGKTVEHIYVLGEEVEQHEAQSVFIDFKVDGKTFYYHFAFNPAFARKNVVNLFKGLPILETKLQLGFVIDSQSFDVDSSRQRVLDKNKTKEQLIKAFSELVAALTDIKVTDPKKFDCIYKAIIATKYPDGEDSKYIRDAFQKVLVPFLKEFVPTSTGGYERLENVRSFSENYQIPLKDIGITAYQWIDESIAQDLRRHSVTAKVIDFPTLITQANKAMLGEWIVSMPEDAYSEFFNACDTYKYRYEVRDVKIFRSNHGNLFSYNELTSNANVYYPLTKKMRFGECEHINYVMSGISEKDYLAKLFEKIKTNIESFKKSESTMDDAANLLSWIAAKDSQYINKIKREIILLKNWHDDDVAFGNLLLERPKGTILFDDYCVKGYVPEAVKSSGWLLVPSKDKIECWDWINKNWEKIQYKEEWGENTHKYIADIKNVYKEYKKAANEAHQIIKKEKKLTLYLDKNGRPTPTVCHLLCRAEKLSEEEYQYLDSALPELRMIPYEYSKDLSNAIFDNSVIDIADIVGKKRIVNEKTLSILLKITDENYISDYYTDEKADGKYEISPIDDGFNYIDSVSKKQRRALFAIDFHHVPLKVKEIADANWEDSNWEFHKLSYNDYHLRKAIEQIENKALLIDFVKESYGHVKDYFFDNLKVINIEETLESDDDRWNVIKYAATDSNNRVSHMKTVFNLIRFKGAALPNSITRRYVKINDKTYDVYDLDDTYASNNDIIDRFLKNFASEEDADFFRDNYYKDKEKIVSDKEVYDKLAAYPLTIEQLRFCLDYALANKTHDCLRLKDNIKLTDALDMILENKFHGFDRYLKVNGIDLSMQTHTNKELLLEEERLPDVLADWLKKHPESLTLFSNLRGADDPYIAIRAALLNNKAHNVDISWVGNMENADEINRLIKWAITRKYKYVYMSHRFKTMMDIIEMLPSEYTSMPLFRYTGETLSPQKEDDLPMPTFELTRYQNGNPFLSWLSWNGSQFQEQLHNSRKLAEYIRSKVIYAFGDMDLLYRHRWEHCHKLNVQTSAETKDYPEHDDPVYRQWKKSADHNGITIHTSKQPVVMNFYIKERGKIVFTEKIHDSVFGYETDKYVIVQQPNRERLGVMKTIARHIESMDFFKVPFIALQSLYVDRLELMNDGSKGPKAGKGKSSIDLSESSLTEEQAQETINKITAETAENIEKVNNITKKMNGEELGRLDEVAEPIMDIVNGLDKEDIGRLAEHKDKLVQMMEDLDEAEEEEISHVRKTISFIGELVYSHYLEHKHLQKDRDFIHASLDGADEYDFEIKPEKLFVDVKTTLYSLKDGTAPFYLHRSQNVFMQKHPDSQYHIVRVSLSDLQLKRTYEELRDTYGKDANPIENSHLRKRCEELAKRFWRGAKIDEFDALSPEYSIKIIEQKKQ